MSKTEAKKIDKELLAIEKTLGQERDRIQDLIDRYDELRIACDEAYYDIMSARDTLSALV